MKIFNSTVSCPKCNNKKVYIINAAADEQENCVECRCESCNLEFHFYENKKYRQFVKDCFKAGLGEKVTNYHGRFFYHGPAVSTRDIQEVIRSTRVKVQWDQLGLGHIVYPC